ncbi:MAG: ribosome biogenesis GTP-binding protein YihA/YsxC [Rikenellaceae bacterium]
MKITQAIFSGSCRFVKDKPKLRLPEFAFIGRSNVGKSSLINALCKHGQLAHISSKPGKTQLINHFLINNSWYLVDLPGYGYAKRSKSDRAVLTEIIRGYINGSEELVNLFVLLDSRLDIQEIDLKFILELGEASVPFSIIFTKCDKNSNSALENQIKKNIVTLTEHWEELPPVFLSSTESGKGREEILNYIGTLLK